MTLLRRLLKFIRRRFFVTGLVLTLLLLLFPPFVEIHRGTKGNYKGQAFLLSDRPCGYRGCTISVQLLIMEIIIIWLLLGIAYKVAPNEINRPKDDTNNSEE